MNYFKKLILQSIFRPYMAFIMVFGTVVFLVGIVINVILFQNMKERKDDEKDKIIIEKQIQSISSHIQQVEQLYTGIRGLKHDLRTHISNIENLIMQEQYNEVLEYTKQFEITMEQLEFEYKTGNPVTDVIINEFSREAQEKSIQFKTDFVFPLETDIKAFDISIILSNGLENAREACESQSGKIESAVHIRSFRRKNTYLIQIRNTCNQVIQFDEEGVPKTTKKDKDVHGMGLKNIQRIARKYQGEVRSLTEINASGGLKSSDESEFMAA